MGIRYKKEYKHAVSIQRISKIESSDKPPQHGREQSKRRNADNAEHLFALKKLALSIGFRAPIYTVTGWNSVYGAKIPVDEVIPVFGAYPEAPWEEHTQRLPLSPQAFGRALYRGELRPLHV